MTILGLDTSNYTTSLAMFNGQTGWNVGRLLDVKPGELGLRQSEALFSHIQRLPELAEALLTQTGVQQLDGIAASTRPRAVEGSYMPCFLAGASQAQTMASLLGVPFYAVSHQQGHLAAAAWSSGHMELLETRFLCWHLSGGTTELLLVEPDGPLPHAARIGGTSDLSAGQLIDRTGQMLGLQFPAGKALDALAQTGYGPKPFVAKQNGLELSFSGLQNKAQTMQEQSAAPEEIAAFVIASICAAVQRLTDQALQLYSNLPVLFSGGVASNSMLRQTFQKGIFAEPRYSTDNALGVAILGWRKKEAEG